MLQLPNLANEQERLKALSMYEIMDTPEEKEYDDIVLLASQICKTPISLISLLDGERQWFKAHIGLETRQTPREVAFCAHAILQEEVFVIENALKDPRFANNPLVTSDPNIRFYAGVPLQTPTGFNLGTLCVIDDKPRTLSKEQHFALNVLAKQVMEKMELRKKIKELHEQQIELTRIRDIQTKMISVISHDVKNPIHALKSLLDLWVQNAVPADKMQLFIKQLSHNLEITSDMLNGLLGWSSMQLAQNKATKEHTNLLRLVQEQLTHLSYGFAQKQNIGVINIPKDLQVYISPEMLRFIVRNLMHNANKFTSNGRIEVSAEQQQKSVLIHVKDTGVGMSQRVLEQLFNWESRHTSRGTAEEKGSGVGLLICKEFVEESGGTILVNSTERQGTTFTISLPTEV